MANLIEQALFTLFHHNVNYKYERFDFNTDDFLSSSSQLKTQYIEEIADVLFKIVTDNLSGRKDTEVSLTLTGGMDSRVILACLLKADVKPNCLTYGNPDAGDIYFARNLARAFDLPFHNAVQQEPDKEWYYKWVLETIKIDNGNSHLHRAHRTAAMAEHAEKYSPKVLFTGHMGGEGLRGLGYNNYFASPFFQIVNEGLGEPMKTLKKTLKEYFLHTDRLDFDALLDEILSLPWMRHNRETNKLFFLYDLVGKIHHAQDIRLYSHYVSNVVPVYLQKEYLEVLFRSPFHFLAKKKGLAGRLANPYVHCKLIEILYPKLLEYPLSNGYRPAEYLKGLWYYVPVKLYRSFKQKKQFAPSFSYGQWYVDFVNEQSREVKSEIWEIFDKNKYMKALSTTSHQQDEGYWHKFSNPIFFNLKKASEKERTYS
ncbi:MAG: asparagine synthase-related protein [Desulfobacterium sp.]|nr:asparagine synthase-related protein [Desulfobacterium sp.]